MAWKIIWWYSECMGQIYSALVTGARQKYCTSTRSNDPNHLRDTQGDNGACASRVHSEAERWNFSWKIVYNDDLATCISPWTLWNFCDYDVVQAWMTYYRRIHLANAYEKLTLMMLQKIFEGFNVLDCDRHKNVIKHWAARLTDMNRWNLVFLPDFDVANQ